MKVLLIVGACAMFGFMALVCGGVMLVGLANSPEAIERRAAKNVKPVVADVKPVASKPVDDDDEWMAHVDETKDEAKQGAKRIPVASMVRVSSGSGSVHVKGYVNKNGHYVAPHTRSAPRR